MPALTFSSCITLIFFVGEQILFVFGMFIIWGWENIPDTGYLNFDLSQGHKIQFTFFFQVLAFKQVINFKGKLV